MTKLPKILKLAWETRKKNLPTEFGIYAVLCKDKEKEWFTFAEFIPQRLPNCKVDFDRWRTLGTGLSDSYARGSADNRFNVVAWGKADRGNR